MKRDWAWYLLIGFLLILFSIVVYGIHFLIFHDAHHIFIYLLGDIAFVFFEVLLVTIVIHQLLLHREKKMMLKKLNMVIGIFFSEVGVDLLKFISGFDSESNQLNEKLTLKGQLTDKEIQGLQKEYENYGDGLNSGKGDLGKLKEFLSSKKEFLLNLLENPNLLEHETFTNLLWAVFHLTEELMHRKDFSRLPKTDLQHLTGDIKRVYGLLIYEWLAYMKHLRSDYPYLYSLAIRTNPFNPAASVEVK